MNRYAKNSFLDKYLFKGLQNLNNGFDAESIKYFSAEEFEIVLKRADEHGILILGIEPWKNGEFFDVLTSGDFSEDVTNWTVEAMRIFKNRDSELQYAATYGFPDKLLAGSYDK